jgi:hypothetical protein
MSLGIALLGTGSIADHAFAPAVQATDGAQLVAPAQTYALRGLLVLMETTCALRPTAHHGVRRVAARPRASRGQLRSTRAAVRTSDPMQHTRGCNPVHVTLSRGGHIL